MLIGVLKKTLRIQRKLAPAIALLDPAIGLAGATSLREFLFRAAFVPFNLSREMLVSILNYRDVHVSLSVLEGLLEHSDLKKDAFDHTMVTGRWSNSGTERILWLPEHEMMLLKHHVYYVTARDPQRVVAALRGALLRRSRVWKVGTPRRPEMQGDGRSDGPVRAGSLAPVALQPFINFRPDTLARVLDGTRFGPVLLSGLSGSGKTQLAIEAAMRSSDDPVIVLRGAQDYADAVGNLTAALGPVSVILDDMPVSDCLSLLDFLDSLSEKVRVFVTFMTNSGDPSFPGMRSERVADILRVPALTPAEIVTLLTALGCPVKHRRRVAEWARGVENPTPALLSGAVSRLKDGRDPAEVLARLARQHVLATEQPQRSKVKAVALPPE